MVTKVRRANKRTSAVKSISPRAKRRPARPPKPGTPGGTKPRRRRQETEGIEREEEILKRLKVALAYRNELVADYNAAAKEMWSADEEVKDAVELIKAWMVATGRDPSPLEKLELPDWPDEREEIHFDLPFLEEPSKETA